MSSRVSIQQIVSASPPTGPAGPALGDEWFNTTTGILFKRTLINGIVDWAAMMRPSATLTIAAGTVNTGTAGNLAYYASSTSAVSPLTTLNWNSGTNTLTLTGTLAATIFNSLSDIRVKQNIQTIENSLEKVLQLRGVSFEWIDNKNKSIGVIAQEVEQVLPEIVTENENGIKSVSYDSIIGLLIEAIKEQQKEIDTIKEQLINKTGL